MTRIILCSLSTLHMVGRGQAYTITVKPVSALPSLDLFLPSKQIVYGHKCFCGDERFKRYQPVTTDQYTEIYRKMITSRMRAIVAWYRSLPPSNTHAITLCCYCSGNSFCHRQLVHKLFLWLNSKLDMRHQVELH